MRSIVFVSLFIFTVACSGEPTPAGAVTDDSFRQWSLPDKLREISGLALTEDERLLAVADESAIVYEIDYNDGHLVKAFALGEKVVKGDFEGIAVLDGDVWLMTSDGNLYRSPEGENGAHVDYERFDTRLDDNCEFEGLTAVPSRQSLALICKHSKKNKKKRVFEWRLVNDEIHRVADFALPVKNMKKAVDRKQMNPSGLAVAPVTGNWLVLAAKQYAIFELSQEGEFIDVIMRLDKERHRQAEGIAVTQDGLLIIADEAGKGRARLSVYSTITGNNKN